MGGGSTVVGAIVGPSSMTESISLKPRVISGQGDPMESELPVWHGRSDPTDGCGDPEDHRTWGQEGCLHLPDDVELFSLKLMGGKELDRTLW